MPFRAQVCTWIAGLGLVIPSLVTAQDRTEREIVELIVRHGPRAQVIRAETEVTRREQLARLAYPNPSLMYSREGAGFTEFLQVEQSLPLFGVRGALSRAGVAATAAAEAERDARLWILRAEARTLVARMTAEEARREAAEAYARDVERLIEVLRTREREGEGSRFDRLRAEQELHEARRQVMAAAVALADVKSLLAAMLPRETTLGRVTGTPAAQPAAPPLEALLSRASSTRAELRALQLSLDRAAFESDAARRGRLPSPTLFGGLKRAEDDGGNQQGGVFGLSLAVPLFDTGRREAARWEAERARIEAERTGIERQIRGEIARAAETLNLLQAAAGSDQESAGDELMRIAEVAYREGELRILELLDAVRAASRAKTRSIEIRLEMRLAQIALERAVGDVLWP